MTPSRRILIVVYVTAGLLAFISVLCSPWLVIRFISAHGHPQDSTIRALENLRLIALGLSVFVLLVGIVVTRMPRLRAVLARQEVIVPLLIILTVAYVGAWPRVGINPGEEGIFVYKALRVLDGEIPHRDYSDPYPPGGAYLFALLFKYFGTSILVERAFNRIMQVVIVMCSYLIARRLIPRPVALLS